jgi:hypothetical protein
MYHLENKNRKLEVMLPKHTKFGVINNAKVQLFGSNFRKTWNSSLLMYLIRSALKRRFLKLLHSQ